MSTLGDRERPLGRGFLGTIFEVYRQSLVLLLRVRLLWLFAVGEAIAAVVAFGIAGHARNPLDGFDLYCLLAWWGLIWLAAPWCSMYLAIHLVHGEIEDRTVQYLFLRPVRRAALLLGKWLAAASVAGAALIAGATLLHVALAAVPDAWSQGVSRAPWAAFVRISAWSALAYAAVGAASAAAFGRPLVVAAGYVVVQMVAAILPVSAGVRAITVSDPLRRLLLLRLEPDAELENLLWPDDRALRSDLIGEPQVALGIWIAVLLGFAMLRYVRAEYDARERE